MGRLGVIILGGGQGKRLHPLTLNRCKPALSYGGRFHLIDIPISNSINSGCNKIYVITQFLSASLHQHIFKTYRHCFNFDGFLEMLPAEEKPHQKEWFQGTADAIRQNLHYLVETPVDYFLILSGDQLYHMDFHHMLQHAQETDADVVIAATPTSKTLAKRMGILKIDKKGFITEFNEKPQQEDLLKKLISASRANDKERPYLGSMGIYLFKKKSLFNLLKEDPREDFGKHLIPAIVEKGKAAAYLFEGYWEDIGTVESFYNANLALTDSNPPFDCYDEVSPIYSDLSHLPGPKIRNAHIQSSIICEGSIIEAKSITHSVLGPRTVIQQGTVVEDSYIMGNDFYHSPTETLPEKLQIGQNCHIKRAILDLHVHLGNKVKLININHLQEYDGDGIYIRDGIIIVTKGTSLPDGFTL